MLDGRGGNIEEADLTVGARDPVAARCEIEVGFRGFEQNARDLPALIDDLVSGVAATCPAAAPPPVEPETPANRQAPALVP